MQQDALAAELGAAKAEEYILGGDDAPEVPADVIPAPGAARYAATETVRSTAEMPLAPKAEAPKKSGWGLFGRKKAAAQDLRHEPAPAPRQPAPRANVAPMERPPAPPTDDLFPEQGTDEQFEIPAFLRRQSGQ
jgi:hypothetical protein